MATKTPHEWSSAALLMKAERYADRMLEQSRDDWQFGFWSVLCLEMILRAAVSHTSQTLLAETKDWNNLLFALEIKGSAGELNPKSIASSEVISRATALYPAFTREHANFCTLHIKRRNSELHSGSLPFDGLDTSVWLSQFYAACSALLSSQGSSLKSIFGEEEATTADTLIKALQDEAAKSVNGTISAYKTIWRGFSPADQAKLSKLAEERSTRADGHLVNCPSCGSIALVQGNPAGTESSTFENDLIILRRPMLPSHFECKACGLKIVGHSKLSACGLGGTYTSKSTVDPVDYFEDGFHERFHSMDEDNNEP